MVSRERDTDGDPELFLNSWLAAEKNGGMVFTHLFELCSSFLTSTLLCPILVDELDRLERIEAEGTQDARAHTHTHTYSTYILLDRT